MRVPSSLKAALGVVAIVVLYFAFSSVFRGGTDAEANNAESGADNQLFTVSVSKISSQTWRDEITVRGRTEALRKVTVRAETVGVVEATPATLGTLVKKGDVLCKLKVDARQASLNEARASLSKAQLDYDGALKLSEEGFRSDTSVASMRAALDFAKAGVEQARLNLNKTNLTAPFDGIFDNRAIEVGDFLSVGDPCGIVIQQSPFLVTGSVSENDVSKVKIGDPGIANLATGEKIEGVVKFVASSADAATRTFRVELEIPNETGSLKDGVTADFTVFAARRNAHLIPRSSLTIDDRGRISVRTIGQADIVDVKNVTLLGESAQGVWVDGLEDPVSLVTRGQNFISDGQTVAVVQAASLTNESEK